VRPFEREQLSELVARLADGDRAAFDQVFDQLWPILRRFAVRLVGDPAVGEDLAQQALLKLFSRAHEYEQGRDALAWALGITHWEYRTWRRKQQRSRETLVADAPEAAAMSTDPEEHVITCDLEAALLAAVTRLGPCDQEILLADIRGQAVVARPATVRKRRQRAVERLRKAWRVIHGTK
jgi:RNA polymerase sigma-70 factor (ECF subfamily)